MATSHYNPKVDFFFEKNDQWQEAFLLLRRIINTLPLSEELKWGQPCYTLGDANVVLMHGFKNYCALLFFKGSLMKDPENILVQQTKNVQATRQIRFADVSEILDLEETLKYYIQEAISVEKSGQKVTLKKTEEFEMPEEFRRRLKSVPALKKAFETLTPGRQRAYLLFFAGAKQSSTREARIDKYMDAILQGKGLNDN